MNDGIILSGCVDLLFFPVVGKRLRGGFNQFFAAIVVILVVGVEIVVLMIIIIVKVIWPVQVRPWFRLLFLGLEPLEDDLFQGRSRLLGRRQGEEGEDSEGLKNKYKMCKVKKKI